MTPQEYYLLHDARLPQDPNRTLSDETYDELNALLDD